VTAVDVGGSRDRRLARQRRYQTAHAADLLARVRKLNDATLTQATRTGFVWTRAELEVAADRTLTAAEVAYQLGRSYWSVKGARRRHLATP
jgi:hypothetical protein